MNRYKALAQLTRYNMMGFWNWVLVPTLLLLSCAQILSIDYGTQYIKASLVHASAGKSFTIVENPKSQRKFINSIGLYNQQRFYEADTLSKRSRGPSNCFIYSRLLIDLHSNPSILQTVRKQLVLDYLQDPNADQLLASFVLSGYPEGQNTVSLLQTVAMTLRYVRRQAEKSAKGTIKDTVLVVPNHWSIHQRRFLVRAAELAGLYVLSIIHENTGSALNYALSQRSTNATETILFYNLGANSVQLTLVQFKNEKADKSPKGVESVYILGDYGQSYVGGLKFDSIIANYFKEQFQSKHKKTLSQRGYIRLLSQSQKIKYVLSANKQATIFVEGIMQGIDFSCVLSRRKFQELAEETIKSVTSPVKRFLFDHDLRPEDLTGVQLVGGATRIPKVQALLAETVGNASLIGSHINGDQSMVLGAAFFGTNSSKKFKVKGINLYDGFNFEMRIVLRNADADISQDDSRYYFKNVTLFKKKSRFGMTKQVSFKGRQNLIVQVYKEEEGRPLQLITKHLLNGIKDINETGFKISLTFQISAVYVVKLAEVKYLYSKDIVQSYTEKVRKPSAKVTEQEQSTEETEEEKTQETAQDQKQNNSTSAKNDKKKKKKEKIEYQTVQRFRNVTKNFEKELEYKSQYYIFEEDFSKSIEKSQKVFARYESKEAAKRLLAQSKNKLQALIYQVKDKIENTQFTVYAQSSELYKLKDLVVLKQSWYEDTVSDDYADYQREWKELNEPVQKIRKRIVQHRQRDDVKKRAFDIISEYSSLSAKIQKGKQWITDEEVNSLAHNISIAKQNIDKLYEKLSAISLNEDSAFRNKDLIKQADIVKDQYFALKGKPKPKDFKSKSQKKQADEQEKKQEEQEKKSEKEQIESDESDKQENNSQKERSERDEVKSDEL